jgi:hypothetical protein
MTTRQVAHCVLVVILDEDAVPAAFVSDVFDLKPDDRKHNERQYRAADDSAKANCEERGYDHSFVVEGYRLLKP